MEFLNLRSGPNFQKKIYKRLTLINCIIIFLKFDGILNKIKKLLIKNNFNY
jgi:hypothetical protein